jgi:ATP-dependent Clp protease ATP-binding subunit ClpC
MFERFTDAARRAVVLAQEEAAGLGHDYIGTEHLLLGLLADRDGVAGRAAAEVGLDAATARAAVADIVGRGKGQPSGHIPFTPPAKKALEYALREALALGDGFIGTEHLLLGLIREQQGVGARVLAEAAGGLDAVRERVLAVRAELGPPTSVATVEDTSQEGLLRHVVLLARRTAVRGQPPFAALVVRDSRVLGIGVDSTLSRSDPTAHAEVAAIRAACRQERTRTLAGADLVSSCEPCPLCREAAAAAGIARIVYAAPATAVPDLGRPLAGPAEPVHVPTEGSGEPFAAYLAARGRHPDIL